MDIKRFRGNTRKNYRVLFLIYTFPVLSDPFPAVLLTLKGGRERIMDDKLIFPYDNNKRTAIWLGG